MRSRRPAPRWLSRPAAALVRRPPVVVDPETTLREAAQLMDAQ